MHSAQCYRDDNGHQVILLWNILDNIVDRVFPEKFFCFFYIGHCDNCPVSAFQQYIQDSGRRLLVLIDVYGFDGLILHGHHEFLVGHLLAE